MKKFDVKKQVKQEKQPTYTVWDSAKGKTFATEKEAIAYEREHRKKTGEFVAITQTTRAVTHKFTPTKKIR